jgi:urea transporter
MLKQYLKITSHSYSQIFFSKSKSLGMAIMLVSFFDFWIGLMGLLSVLIANQSAMWFKFSQKNIDDGFYGFNALLVGLGTAVIFTPGIKLVIVVAIMSVLTLFITLVLEGLLSKYYLPFLSLPFLLGIWIIDLSQNNLIGIGISERGIYYYNELFALGGKHLVDFYNLMEGIQYPFYLKEYFLSLSAIAFQYNELAGFIIAVTLFFSSRISFTLSLIGFYIAILFYQFAGIDSTQLSYTFIGFNYILTSIALGGIFLIPSKWSYSWMMILLPITVIITFGMGQLFYYLGLPIYSLPFNIVVLMFLYVMKLRLQKGDVLVEPFVQHNSPEKNLYQHVNTQERFPIPYYLPVYLPVLGDWSISQGHNGEYTHIGEWGDAWDFVILSSEKSQFKNSGDFVEDYFCYNKPIVAPADGTIVELFDGIDDNIIGEVNTIHNWGNSLVIKHSEYLYSQLSHLKIDSFKVKKGDFVKKGQILASVGNSGRSPYPHLHFQFQTMPYIGSKTFKYPFESVINKTAENSKVLDYVIPKENDLVSNIETNQLLQSALNLIPGQRLKFVERGNVFVQVFENEIADHEIEVRVDAFNQSYLKCLKTGAFAYYNNNGTLFQFINFEGSKKSFLYQLYLSLYKVEQCFYKDLSISDSIAIDSVFNGKKRFIQDLIAPFHIFLKAEFTLKYCAVDSDFSPSEIEVESSIELKSSNKKIKDYKYKIAFDARGIKFIETVNK